ncbi:MAG: BrnT family toxin [Bacteroidota bacterium]|jgi:uncharacterized DUF497 family protein
MISFAKQLGVEEHQLRLVLGSTRIEYDPEKENINRQKHGYSLESAAYLLQRRLLPIQQPSMLYKGPTKQNGEHRYEIITLDDDNKTVVYFVITMREDEIVRIISFRKASRREASLYFASPPK